MNSYPIFTEETNIIAVKTVTWLKKGYYNQLKNIRNKRIQKNRKVQLRFI